MIEVHCDAHICACPSPTERPERFDDFIAGILLVREVGALPSVTVSISRCTAEVLYAEGGVPMRALLEKAILELGREDLDARDILEVIYSILTREPFLEDAVRINDVLYDDLSTVPMLENKRSVSAHQSLEKHLVLATILAHLRYHGCGDKIVIVTTGFDRSDNVLGVSANIVCVDGLDADAITGRVDAKLGFCQAWQSFCAYVDPATIWSASKTDAEYLAALNFSLSKERFIRGQVGGLDWRFGKRFLASLAALNFDAHPTRVRMLLRAIAEIVLGQSMHATHPIRESEGGNSPQLRRGAAKAWRRDIDHEFHLHYWGEAATVEFSRVVTHNDLSID